MPKMSMSVKRGERVKKRETPSTLIKKTKIAKQREKMLKMTPQQQAEIMAKVATEQRFVPSVRATMWAVPPPKLPADLPAVQLPETFWTRAKKYGIPIASELAGWAGPTLAKKAASTLVGLKYPDIAKNIEALKPDYFTQRTFHNVASTGLEWATEGWGTLLRRDHPALYLASSADVGTPFNPLRKSMEVVPAY